jgi:hypothetical protein
MNAVDWTVPDIDVQSLVASGSEKSGMSSVVSSP